MTQHDLTLVPGSRSAEVATEVLELKHLIDGKWVASSSGAEFERHSPANGQLASRAAQGGVMEFRALVHNQNVGD